MIGNRLFALLIDSEELEKKPFRRFLIIAGEWPAATRFLVETDT